MLWVTTCNCKCVDSDAREPRPEPGNSGIASVLPKKTMATRSNESGDEPETCTPKGNNLDYGRWESANRAEASEACSMKEIGEVRRIP